MLAYAHAALFHCSLAEGGSAAGEKTREQEAVAHRFLGALFVKLERGS